MQTLWETGIADSMAVHLQTPVVAAESQAFAGDEAPPKLMPFYSAFQCCHTLQDELSGPGAATPALQVEAEPDVQQASAIWHPIILLLLLHCHVPVQPACT